MSWEIIDAPEQEKQRCAIELSPSVNQKMLCEIWQYTITDANAVSTENNYMQARLHHMIHGLMAFGTLNTESDVYKELAWLRELVSGGYYK